MGINFIPRKESPPHRRRRPVATSSHYYNSRKSSLPALQPLVEKRQTVSRRPSLSETLFESRSRRNSVTSNSRLQRKPSFTLPFPSIRKSISNTIFGDSSSQSSSTVNLRIGIIGAKSSGKTALLVRFLTGRFCGEYVSGETITYRHSCTFLKGKIDTEFVDESSDESKRGDCDAFIVTFDMSNRNSLQAILSPLQAMRQNRQPFVVIGCKKDTVAFMTNKEREVLENKCQVAHIFCVSAREPKEFDEIRRAFGHLYSQVVEIGTDCFVKRRKKSSNKEPIDNYLSVPSSSSGKSLSFSHTLPTYTPSLRNHRNSFNGASTPTAPGLEIITASLAPGSIECSIVGTRGHRDESHKSSKWAKGFNLWKKRKSSSTSSSDETDEFESPKKGFYAIVTSAMRNKKQLVT